MSTIMPAFDTFPQEGAIIGRLLAGYGEIELSLCMCVVQARDDHDMVFKAMFRPRGETQRIDVADALGRKPYEDAGLGTPFGEVIGAARYCLKIRNQFSHCYWTDNFGQKLGFVQVEEVARGNASVDDISLIPSSDIDLSTLQAQEAYFAHTHRCLKFLFDSMRIKKGRLTTPLFPAPKKVERPPLCKP